MFERLKKFFRKDEVIADLEEENNRLRNEITRLETKCRGLEELNKGLASDLTIYKRKWKQAKKGGKQ